MTRWLTDDELAEIRRQTRRVRGSYSLPPDASELDRTKYDLCRRMIIYLRERKLTQEALAKKLGISPARLSEILHYRIHRVSLDRLWQLHAKLNPRFRLKVA